MHNFKLIVSLFLLFLCDPSWAAQYNYRAVLNERVDSSYCNSNPCIKPDYGPLSWTGVINFTLKPFVEDGFWFIDVDWTRSTTKILISDSDFEQEGPISDQFGFMVLPFPVDEIPPLTWNWRPIFDVQYKNSSGETTSVVDDGVFSVFNNGDNVGWGTLNYNTTLSVSFVPEPSTWLLLVAGFGTAGLVARLGRDRVDNALA